MTQGEFIQYILDNYCDVSEDINGTHYQVKKRGGRGNSMKTSMVLADNEKRMELPSMCIICYNLSIDPPDTARDYYENFFEPIIIKKHLSKQNK